MMNFAYFLAAVSFLFLNSVATAQGPTTVNVSAMNYSDLTSSGLIDLQGFISLPKIVPAPAVVIIPDWDGVNFYEQQRATMIAKDLGYVAFAADIYGAEKHNVDNITERVELAGYYRGNSTLFSQRIKAAVDFVKSQPEVDANNVALIGYCFGGTGVLQYGLLGGVGVVAIASFHGGLVNFTESSSGFQPKLLVLSGGDDDTSTSIMDLENTLNANNASWEITRYSGVQHAFTVFSDVRYNELVDKRSWYSMTGFLAEAFGDVEYMDSKPKAYNVQTINYNDTGNAMLRGYLATPDMEIFAGPHPAVIILPDWDGVNTYEKERATLLSELGYMAFAADIYGKDLQEGLDMATKIELSTLYRNDTELYIQRISAAVLLIQADPMVDTNSIGIIGYCFGGTGIIDYAFSGMGVKAAVSFHGGLTDLDIPQPGITIQPYVLVLSGGIDDAQGNQTELEEKLNEANATWEITRYAGVDHAFTVWNGSLYNLMADARSFDSMISLFAKVMPPQRVSATIAPISPSVTYAPSDIMPSGMNTPVTASPVKTSSASMQYLTYSAVFATAMMTLLML